MRLNLRRLFLIAIFLLMNSIIALASDSDKELAVYNFSFNGLSQLESMAISDRIRNELIKFDTYNITEKYRVNEVAGEMKVFSSEICSDPSCLVKVGQFLDVDYVVGGDIVHVGQLFTINASIIDVVSGKKVNSVSEDYIGSIENFIVDVPIKVVAQLLAIHNHEKEVSFTGTSDLVIQSDPAGATVYLNNMPIDKKTPCTIQGLSAGYLKVRLKKGEYSGAQLVYVGTNEVKDIKLKLVKGELNFRIFSTPLEADVIINNKFVGKTPMDFKIQDSSIVYKISLSKQHYTTVNDTIYISGEKIQRLSYNLNPCGHVVIDNIFDAYVYLDDELIYNTDSVKCSNKYNVTASLDGDRIKVFDVGFGEHAVTIIKEHYLPYCSEFNINDENRHFILIPDFELKKGALIVENNINRSVALNFHNTNHDKTVSVKPDDRDTVRVYYGNYDITGVAPKYHNFRNNIDVFSDSVIRMDISPRAPLKSESFYRSIVLPGWGHIYSFQKIKGGLLLSAAALGFCGQFISYINFTDHLDSYNHNLSLYQNANTLESMAFYKESCLKSKDKLETSKTNFLLSSGLLLSSYIYALIDIQFNFPEKYYHDQIDFSIKGNQYEISYNF